MVWHLNAQGACQLLQLVVRLGMIVHHALTEFLDLVIRRFLRSKLPKFYFGQSTFGRLLYECPIGGIELPGIAGCGGSWRILPSGVGTCVRNTRVLRRSPHGKKPGYGCAQRSVFQNVCDVLHKKSLPDCRPVCAMRSSRT